MSDINKIKMSEKEILSIANENSKMLGEIFEQVVEKYAGLVVAVENKKIIESAKSIEELHKKLKMKKKNFSHILIVSIPPRDVAYIL